ncbi:MAG: NADH:flavin oxidoreductase [Kiloniellales bacterium]|nr:NADH:flavin oxidoreductase [Kiloniellales bacterium]
MTRQDPLLEPFTLKGLTIRNRIMSTSHAPAYVKDGHPRERYQLYHEEKAKGGIGLTMFGGSTNVAPDSPSVFGQIYAADDSVIPHFQALADRVHKHGAAIMCQITHMGRRTTWNDGEWLPVIAPSRVREPAHRGFPKEMDQYDIDRTVAAYAATARRVKEGGLDGVELLAHGHLLEQFWSRRVNKRSDGYGGSLENRMRFSLEVLEAVRREVGPDFVVGIRMGSESDLEDDLTLEENLDIAEKMEQSGLVDFLNINRGQIESDQTLAHMMPGMSDPLGVHLHVLKHFRGRVKLPLFHACRIIDLASARHAVEAGLLDMVGMTRAHIADPHIVSKLMRGEEERIRPCVGAGYCLDRIYAGGEALCIHNAATGREATMPHVVPRSDKPGKKAVVVGGGPGGLEAARVLAERGHEVVLFEAAKALGGQVNLAAKASWRGDMVGIVQWLEHELEHLGVTVHTNRYAEEVDIIAERPDIVIMATGGLPDPVLDEQADLVLSVVDVLSGSVTLSGSVMVYDDNGQHPGPSCAEFLAERGCQVELVTPDRMAAAEMGTLSFPIFLEHLYQHGATLTPDRRLAGVERQDNRLKVTLRNEFTGAEETRLVDHLVVEHGTIPMDEVFHGLKEQATNHGHTDQAALLDGRPQPEGDNPGGLFRLFRVGDAVASRNVHAAIYDSLRLCKDL